MKISVITVSYNASDRIERTIRSVMAQDYSDYEYIIIDGSSNDGTIDIITKYSIGISYWISEPDNGIYCAMNKGVRIASGEYCIFMNAGDMFFSSTVLSEVAYYLDGNYSVVMGNQVYLTSSGKFSFFGKAWNSIDAERLFFDSLYHQASFIRRSDLVRYPYDESLKMVSDWKEMLLFFVVNHLEYRGINVTVDYFIMDGLTYSQVDIREKERRIVWNEIYSSCDQQKYLLNRERYKSSMNIVRYFNFINRILGTFYHKLVTPVPSL